MLILSHVMTTILFCSDIYIVVHVEKTRERGTLYKVDVAAQAEVPTFGPALPPLPIFQANHFFREFLLTKSNY